MTKDIYLNYNVNKEQGGPHSLSSFTVHLYKELLEQSLFLHSPKKIQGSHLLYSQARPELS